MFENFLEAQRQSEMEQEGGITNTKVLMLSQLNTAKSHYQFFLSSSFFTSYYYSQSYWTERFENKFIQRFSELNPFGKQLVFCHIMYLLHGHFNFVDVVETGNALPYMCFFKLKINEINKVALVAIGLQKLPNYDIKTQSLKGFRFVHYMRFLTIQNWNQKLLNQFLIYQENCLQDPSRWDFGDKLVEEFDSKSWHIISHLFNNGKFITNFDSQSGQYKQSKFWNLTLNCADYYHFDQQMNRWVNDDWNEKKKKEVNYDNDEQQMSSAIYSQFIKERFINFNSAGKLINLLQKIPNFEQKIRLTSEEKKVIGEDGNVLVIGRSGTGKTTCCILRLFAIEMLFKLRLALYRNQFYQELNVDEVKVKADDIEKTVGLHCIFVTASPVLTNEVQKYYTKLTEHLKIQLKKKEEIIRQKMKDKKQDEQEEDIIMQAAEEQVKDLAFEEVGDIEGFEEEGDEEYKKEMQEAMQKEYFQDDYMERMEKMSSLNQLDEAKDFPAFLTIKRLLVMIEGSLTIPFFMRNAKSEIIGMQSSSYWHNENAGIIKIDTFHKQQRTLFQEVSGQQEDPDFVEDSDQEEDDEMEEEMNKNPEQYNSYDMLKRNMQMSQSKLAYELEQHQGCQRYYLRGNKWAKRVEIDYEIFEKQFWPSVKKRILLKNSSMLTPAIVWTQIYSYIKGSVQSYLQVDNHLNQYQYFNIQEDKYLFLSKNDKKLIYQIFQRYERWKYFKNGYDLMDLVNYILIQMFYGRYNGIQIHYLMIDEVQDLPHNVLLLLSKVATEGIFFSGDTAQSIGKGVGFRFCDLHHIFDSEYFSKGSLKVPTIHHLTVNFRSHNQILQLANSVVTLLEICFPKTIDKMKKEKSNIAGPKPIVLESQKVDDLFQLLLSCEEYQNKNGEQEEKQEEQTAKFGCNQVILVRDLKSKRQLPAVFQNALCLTIYEAKGLEFDDVILFNFFADSTIENAWKLLRYVNLTSKFVTKEELASSLTFHYSEEEAKEKQTTEEQTIEQTMRSAKEIKGLLESEDSSLFGLTIEEFDSLAGNLQIEVKQAEKSANMPIYLEQYSALCNELKQLYVAVTRPKRKLIIFDQNIEQRLLIQEFWKKLDLVELVTSSQLNQIAKVSKKDIDYSKYFLTVCSKMQQQEWKLQGLKMLKHKFYEQAAKCFKNSKDDSLLKRATAFMKAEQCAKQLLKINNQWLKLQQPTRWRKLTKPEKNQKNQQLVKLFLEKMDVKKDLEDTGGLFLECKLKQHAAQCYFTCEKYESASKIYEELQLWKQAGEVYYIMKKYEQAANCFEKIKDYYRTIECYVVLKNYEKILQCIHTYKELMTIDQQQQLVDEYLPKFFGTLVKKLQMDSQFGIQWEKEKQDRLQCLRKKQIQWEKYKLKQQKLKEKRMKMNEVMDIIKEDENDDDDDDDGESVASLSDFDENELKELEENQRLFKEKQGEKVEEEEGKIQQIEIEDQKAGEQSLTMENISKLKQQEQQEDDENFEQIDLEVISKNKDCLDFQSEQLSLSQQKQISSLLDEESIISHLTLNSANPDTKSQQSQFDIISQISLQPQQKEEIESQQTDEYDRMDHLSHIDFDDEWLSQADNNKSISILDSIVSLRKSNSQNTLEQFSEYSSVGYEDILKSQICLVQTHADIFVQDETMQLIIKYLSMFSEECKNSLEGQRSKGILLTQNKEEQNQNKQEQNDMLDFIVDLDKLTIETIYLLLDVLENYELFKLNIFICNRYQLADRIGHYLASIAHRYSPLAKQSHKLNFNKLCTASWKQSLREQALIANAAVHNVLENINPAFLKLKQKGEEISVNNHLGIQCFQCLIMLGYWKKCVYLLDFENALALANSFADFYNYKLIFILGNSKYKKVRAQYASDEKAKLLMTPNFKVLPISFDVPKDQYEMDLVLITLQHLQWEFNTMFGTFVNFNFTKKVDLFDIKELLVPAFPNYVYFNGVFWKLLGCLLNQDEGTNEKVNELSALFVSSFQQATDDLWELQQNPSSSISSEYLQCIHTYDLITFFIEFLAFNANYKLQSISNTLYCIFSKLPIEVQTKFFLVWDQIFKLFEKCKLGKQETVIRQAVLNTFRIREIQGEIMNHLGNKSTVIIHETSQIFPYFFKDRSTDVKLMPIDINGNFYLVLDNSVLWENICIKINSWLQILAFDHLKIVMNEVQLQQEYGNSLEMQINCMQDNQQALKYCLYQLHIQKTLQSYDLLINKKNLEKMSKLCNLKSNFVCQQILQLQERDLNIAIEQLLQQNNFNTLCCGEIKKVLTKEEQEIIEIEEQCEQFAEFFSNKKILSKKKKIQHDIQSGKNFDVSSENFLLYYKTTGSFSMIYYNIIKKLIILFGCNRFALEETLKNEKERTIANSIQFIIEELALKLIQQSKFVFGKQQLLPILIEEFELLRSIKKEYCLVEDIFGELKTQNPLTKLFQQFQIYISKYALFQQGYADHFLENTYNFISKTFHQLSITNLITIFEQCCFIIIISNNLNCIDNEEAMTIYFPSNYISYFGKEHRDNFISQIKSNQQNLILNINTTTKEQLNFPCNPLSSYESVKELLYWIQKVIEKYYSELVSLFGELKIIECISLILLALLVNCFHYSREINKEEEQELTEILQTIQLIVNLLIEDSIIYTQFKEIQSFNQLINILNFKTYKSCKNFKQSALTMQNSPLSFRIQLQTVTSEEFEIITNNNLIQANYKQNKLMWEIAQRILSQKRIAIDYQNYKITSHKYANLYRKAFCDQNTNFSFEFQPVLQEIFNQTQQYQLKEFQYAIKVFLLKFNFIFGVISQISEQRKSILTEFCFREIINALDFHYIIQQLLILQKYQSEFIDAIKSEFLKLIQSKKLTPEEINKLIKLIESTAFQKSIMGIYVQKKNQVNQLSESFTKWLHSQIQKKDENIIMIQKNKALLALKMSKRGMLVEAQKMIKKVEGKMKELEKKHNDGDDDEDENESKSYEKQKQRNVFGYLPTDRKKKKKQGKNALRKNFS